MVSRIRRQLLIRAALLGIAATAARFAAAATARTNLRIGYQKSSTLITAPGEGASCTTWCRLASPPFLRIDA
jgi:hypothetical protein